MRVQSSTLYSGALAQLVECYNGIVEVIGSNPIRSKFRTYSMCFKKFVSWFKKKPSETFTTPPSLNIEEFVQASLVGITSGIRGAQEKYRNENSAYASLICPAWAPITSNLGGGTKGHADKIHDIEFDLAVTVDESSSAKCNGRAAIKVTGLYGGDLGFSSESMGSHSTLSRIRFKIPIRYPLAMPSKADFDKAPGG
jgi:hypothetical protein